MTTSLRNTEILVLAPHTDDGELGAGGAINKWVTAGNVVHYVAFSACETVQPPTRRPAVLRSECVSATTALGIASDRCRVLDFEVRRFSRDRQEILDAMVKLNKELRPSLVVAPSLNDTHQDHAVIASEARRALKGTSILGYELPWNNFRFEYTAFAVLERSNVLAKCDSLAEYHSQSERAYMSRDYQEALLKSRGLQVGAEFAECFEVVRWYL